MKATSISTPNISAETGAGARLWASVRRCPTKNATTIVIGSTATRSTPRFTVSTAELWFAADGRPVQESAGESAGMG
ncbi:hypothetical protein [Streptomyces sp. P9-A4]|uniref:hypothetical protein n=1 Tax=Streptomyces sp. P9-A4 TaxID=3072285 RepID=UPI002FCA5C41